MEKPHERLDRFMNDRRLQLPKIGGKTVKWFQVAERAGITVTTLTALRKGQNVPTEDTKRGIEDALLWAAGSIDAIMDGGEPTPARPSVRISQVRMDVPAPPPLPVPTDDELRASGLAPETVEALLDMRRHVERLMAKRDEEAIRRANRVLRALDEGQDAG